MLDHEAGPVIVASTTDPASYNIAQQLIQHNAFVQSSAGSKLYRMEKVFLVLADKECIYVEPSEVPVRASSVIFVSKHRSAEGRAALTTHTTGNLAREAKYGGNPNQVSWVDPQRVKQALVTLHHGVREAGLEIEVTMESTHHGPTSFDVPVCFVEVGSSEQEWGDPNLARIAANAALAAALAKPNPKMISTVGFGGTHYPAKHTKLSIEDNYAVGHHVPKHAFESELTQDTIRTTFQKTFGGCNTALVDWKGLKGRHRTVLLDWLSNWSVEVVRC